LIGEIRFTAQTLAVFVVVVKTVCFISSYDCPLSSSRWISLQGTITRTV